MSRRLLADAAPPPTGIELTFNERTRSQHKLAQEKQEEEQLRLQLEKKPSRLVRRSLAFPDGLDEVGACAALEGSGAVAVSANASGGIAWLTMRDSCAPNLHSCLRLCSRGSLRTISTLLCVRRPSSRRSPLAMLVLALLLVLPLPVPVQQLHPRWVGLSSMHGPAARLACPCHHAAPAHMCNAGL